MSTSGIAVTYGGMSDEYSPRPNRYLPPDQEHTAYIVDRQNGQQIGTRFWAPFNNPQELVDRDYWHSLFSPDTGERVQAAIITTEHGLQLVWSEGIAPEHLLTRNERECVLVSVNSAVIDQDIGSGVLFRTRWIRAYANGEKEDEGASLLAGSFTRMLEESDVDQGTIYTAAAAYEEESGLDVHILTDETL